MKDLWKADVIPPPTLNVYPPPPFGQPKHLVTSDSVVAMQSLISSNATSDLLHSVVAVDMASGQVMCLNRNAIISKHVSPI